MPKVALVLGVLLSILSLLCLLLWSFLPIGINDAEWGHIAQTGLPSNGGAGLVWTDWQTNHLPTLTQFPSHPLSEVSFDKPIIAYRFGKGDTPCLTFGFYQAKCRIENGDVVIVPAYGPESFARMKWSIPLGGLALGIVMTGAGMGMKRKARQPSKP